MTKDQHWMPPAPRKQYVHGVPHEVVEIDPKKSRACDKDDWYDWKEALR